MNVNKTYSHKEIASVYFPELSPQSASRRLSYWIDRDEELFTQLKRTGYLKRQRFFTPRQIELLFEHLGKPGEI